MGSSSIHFPANFFVCQAGTPDSDDPDIRRAVNWFKSFLTEAEWTERRNRVANRLYDAALQKTQDEKGRFFDENDTFGWYLFLGEAYVDHIHNYEPMFGSRIVPLLQAIGRNLDLLKHVPGIDERARKLLTKAKGQPNGGLFELLVAGAYLRTGAEVAFVDESRRSGKKHEMDIRLGGRTLAVECKRLETSQYGEAERARARVLWKPAASGLTNLKRSTFCDVQFTAELRAVPDEYLTEHVQRWLASSLPNLFWHDELGYGIVGDLDSRPPKVGACERLRPSIEQQNSRTAFGPLSAFRQLHPSLENEARRKSSIR